MAVFNFAPLLLLTIISFPPASCHHFEHGLCPNLIYVPIDIAIARYSYSRAHFLDFGLDTIENHATPDVDPLGDVLTITGVQKERRQSRLSLRALCYLSWILKGDIDVM